MRKGLGFKVIWFWKAAAGIRPHLWSYVWPLSRICRESSFERLCTVKRDVWCNWEVSSRSQVKERGEKESKITPKVGCLMKLEHSLGAMAAMLATCECGRRGQTSFNQFYSVFTVSSPSISWVKSH